MRTLLALLLLASVVAAVSSSEAIEALGPCVRGANPQLSSLPQSFMYGGTPYWVFYYSFSSGRRLFAAVDVDEGLVLADETRLKGLAEGVYNHVVLEDYVKAKGWSSVSVGPLLDDSLRVIGEQSSKLQVFRTQTEEKYPDLRLNGVEAALERLRNSVEAARTSFDEAFGQQQMHESALGADTSTYALSAYNRSFNSLFEAFADIDAYSGSISDAEAKVYKMGIPDPDNKNINSNLENLREVGLNSLYSKAKASDPRNALSALLAGREKWTGDSVSSFLFQDLSCRSSEAYESLRKQYNQVAQSENVLIGAGFGERVLRIKEDWARIELLKKKRTADSYSQILSDAPALSKDIAALTEDYKRFSEPTPTPKPVQKGPDAGTIIAVLLLLALGGYGIWMYKKKQEADAEGLS